MARRVLSQPAISSWAFGGAVMQCCCVCDSRYSRVAKKDVKRGQERERERLRERSRERERVCVCVCQRVRAQEELNMLSDRHVTALERPKE